MHFLLHRVLFKRIQKFFHKISHELEFFHTDVLLLVNPRLKCVQPGIIHRGWFDQDFAPVLILTHDILTLIQNPLELLIILFKIRRADKFDILKLFLIVIHHLLLLLHDIVDGLVHQVRQFFVF